MTRQPAPDDLPTFEPMRAPSRPRKGAPRAKPRRTWKPDRRHADRFVTR